MINSGSYQIYIELKKDVEIKVGALGMVNFKKGRYAYTGSSMKNLAQRIERHKRKEKKIKWHIDYLLTNENTKIIKIDIFPSQIKEECSRNLELLKNGNISVPVKGFGSSDCHLCKSHLVYFEKQ